ncbi:MAG: YqgE/AlgH family protein [Alphaproteobacteria bacterium]
MAEDSGDKEYLTGKLIVAMPNMTDPRFANSVIFICGHDKSGAMGLVINRLVETLTFFGLMEQLNIPVDPNIQDRPINYGGPVEMGRGFVLHSSDYMHESSVSIAENVVLTATVDILRDLAQGGGPERCLLALGYAGWSPGQLEKEIQNNGWLEVEVDEELIFETRLDHRWREALEKIGVDPAMLSASAGHA